MRERVPENWGTTPPAAAVVGAVAFAAGHSDTLREWLTVDRQGGVWSDFHDSVLELVVGPRAVRALPGSIREECVPPR